MGPLLLSNGFITHNPSIITHKPSRTRATPMDFIEHIPASYISHCPHKTDQNWIHLVTLRVNDCKMDESPREVFLQQKTAECDPKARVNACKSDSSPREVLLHQNTPECDPKTRANQCKIDESPREVLLQRKTTQSLTNSIQNTMKMDTKNIAKHSTYTNIFTLPIPSQNNKRSNRICVLNWSTNTTADSHSMFC
eukprot:693138_1